MSAVLSPRQRQVHDLMLMGKGRAEIARRLGISLSTAKVHIGKTFRKTGVRSKVELILQHRAPRRSAA